MNVEDGLEVLRCELRERLVAQDAGVRDQDVDLAEILEGRVDDLLAAFEGGDGVEAGDGVRAERFDLLDDLAGSGIRGARSVGRTAEIVDHDTRPAAGQVQGIGSSDTAAGAGDDGDLAVESHLITHELSPAVRGGFDGDARKSAPEHATARRYRLYDYDVC